MQPPAQELVAKDLHGVAWTFRHIYRGMHPSYTSDIFVLRLIVPCFSLASTRCYGKC